MIVKTIPNILEIQSSCQDTKLYDYVLDIEQAAHEMLDDAELEVYEMWKRGLYQKEISTHFNKKSEKWTRRKKDSICDKLYYKLNRG